MNLVRTLTAASLVLTATAAASTLAWAATAGRGDGARGHDPGHFQTGGVRRFARDHDWRGHRHHGGGFPYLAGGFYGGYDPQGYASEDYGPEGYGPEGYGPEGYGPAAFGPEPPYGYGFRGPVAQPMAPDLAPSAYGPGVHDGAYAYGYNGYAQTPPLSAGYGAPGWSMGVAGRSCGC